jgi:hypothetical protein
MGQEVMSATIYAWVTKPSETNTLIVFALADSPSEAAEKIVLKLAAGVSDTGKLISVQQVMESVTPLTVDFSEGVGVLTIDIEIQR